MTSDIKKAFASILDGYSVRPLYIFIDPPLLKHVRRILWPGGTRRGNAAFRARKRYNREHRRV